MMSTSIKLLKIKIDSAAVKFFSNNFRQFIHCFHTPNQLVDTISARFKQSLSTFAKTNFFENEFAAQSYSYLFNFIGNNFVSFIKRSIYIRRNNAVI